MSRRPASDSQAVNQALLLLLTGSPGQMAGRAEPGLPIMLRGWHIGFDGYNSIKSAQWPQGQPNQMVARSVESGTSFMAANPVIKKSISKARPAAKKAMERAGDQQIKKIAGVGNHAVREAVFCVIGFRYADYCHNFQVLSQN